VTDWITLRAKFPDDEYEEIERIKEKYDLSINEIIRPEFFAGQLMVPLDVVSSFLSPMTVNVGPSSDHFFFLQYQEK